MSKKTVRKSKGARKEKARPGLLRSNAPDREEVMAAEAVLMKAAIEFAYQWGRDQTAHPRLYWLELHLETWAKLARAALAYAERLNPPNV